MTNRPILVAALVLAGFAVCGVGVVAITHDLTAERIAANEHQALLRTLEAIVPEGGTDNDIAADHIEVHNYELLGATNTRVYRGRRDGQPAALVLDPLVPNGYAGPIKLLVSVLADGSLGGVRVVSHHETPGLGDRIEEQKSNWVKSFTGRSLEDPPIELWRVKRDGGVFDQFTGATITPRAIVQAVKNTLLFVQQQGDRLYQTAPEAVSAKAGGS